MNKPLTVARQEFAETIVTAINQAEVPAFVISEVLKNALVEVEKISQAQYEKDMTEWKKIQEEGKHEDNKDKVIKIPETSNLQQ